MKKNIFLLKLLFILVPVFAPLCVSCASVPGITKARSWSLPPKDKIAGTVWISGVEADRAGVRGALENEAAAILPLLLSNLKYAAVEKKEGADFIVELKLREREYIRGWKTVSSLAAEIYFYPGGYKTTDAYAVPAAAGRAVVENSGSLASSNTLSRLIEKAAQKAIFAVEKNK